MRISDWSSDVCSSDLASRRRRTNHRPRRPAHCGGAPCCWRSTSRTRLRRVAFLQDGLKLLAHQRLKLLGLARAFAGIRQRQQRSEEHTSELPSLMRISYAVFCLKNKTKITTNTNNDIKQKQMITEKK